MWWRYIQMRVYFFLFYAHHFGRDGFLGSRIDNKPKSYACIMVRTLRLRSQNTQAHTHLYTHLECMCVCLHDDCRRQRHRHRWWCSSFNYILASRCRLSLLRLLLLVRLLLLLLLLFLLLHSFDIKMRFNISAQQRTIVEMQQGEIERENERKTR